MSKLYSELKRRNVFRIGIAYAVTSWLLLQIVDVIGPILRLPAAFARYVLFFLAIGFLPALVIAWAFELTPEGVKRERAVNRSGSISARSGRRLDRAIIVILVLAVAFLLFDKLGPDIGSKQAVLRQEVASGESATKQNLTRPSDKSVAVLPFVKMSSGPDDGYFADGLTEEIINALAQVPELMVTARTSAFHFKGKNLPVEDIARQLGVAHVVEGSVRRAGDQLRVTAQLIRTEDGFNLWSETYDRRSEDTLAVQTDIAVKVAAALNLVLDDVLRERMRQVGTRNVEAFIAFQKGIEFYERAHSEPNQISLLRQANQQFEQAIALAPDLFAAYEYHADLFSHILIANASGELDGDITSEDVAGAPTALQHDYEQAVRHARSPAERYRAEFDGSLLQARWRGLALLSEKAAAAPGCEVTVWLNLAGPLSGDESAVLDAYRRMAACDPLRLHPVVHTVSAYLRLGLPDEAVRIARAGLQRIDSPFLSRVYALALGLSGDIATGKATATRQIRAEDSLLLSQAALAALAGDEEAAALYQEEFLGKYGPNDRETLVLEASRGRRNEANRMAAAIDARPFGHMALLQAISLCFCGAPFDLAATPRFAALLNESGFRWPPVMLYKFPLKDW